MELLNNLLGLHTEKLENYQMVARAVIIFFTSLVLIRIAGIRIFGKQSSFDIFTCLMLGSIMGRAIIANQSFSGSILAALTIILLHRFTAWITFRSKKIGALIKGSEILLMKDGVPQNKNLSKALITENDILEALRRDANITTLNKIKEVYLERSGDISIIKE